MRLIMAKIAQTCVLVLIFLTVLMVGLWAQAGYYIEQNFVGSHFSPYGIKVSSDGFIYTYGSYFYYDGGSGPFAYGTGFSGSDQSGAMLWSNAYQQSIDGSVYTVGIDTRANGEFYSMTSLPAGSGSELRLHALNTTGQTTILREQILDAAGFTLTDALRLPDNCIALVGKIWVYQGPSQWINKAVYYRFTSEGEILGNSILDFQPGEPAQYPLDMVLKPNGNLLVTLVKDLHIAVSEITFDGQEVNTAQIPVFAATPVELDKIGKEVADIEHGEAKKAIPVRGGLLFKDRAYLIDLNFHLFAHIRCDPFPALFVYPLYADKEPSRTHFGEGVSDW